jgi:hypothetical protein
MNTVQFFVSNFFLPQLATDYKTTGRHNIWK